MVQPHRHGVDAQPGLMRKAVGWVLREVGKKDDAALRSFLDSNIARLSSITLSYATEKFTPEERAVWRGKAKAARPR